MRAMMKSLALLIAGGVALALSAVPVRATPVNWEFIALSCHCASSPRPALPDVIATFSSPDTSGSYSYLIPAPDASPIITGDTNFSFTFLEPPLLTELLPAGPCGNVSENVGCGFNITWDQSPADFMLGFGWGSNYGGTTDIYGAGNNDTISEIVVASDNLADGGTYFGYWVNPVPEPSSLVGLATAIVGFFVILLRRGQAEPLWWNPLRDHRTHRNLARKFRV